MVSAFRNKVSLLTVLVLTCLWTMAGAGVELDRALAECPGENHLVKLEGKMATASMWDNFRRNPGSIAFECQQLIDRALADQGLSAEYESHCQPPCVAHLEGAVILRSKPNKLLSDYSEKELCQKFLTATTRDPLRYEGLRFKSSAEFNDWFSNFSQGSGDQGEDLYQRCPGSCSPQFEAHISQENSGLEVDVMVVCGHARDKDDNQYQLSTWRMVTCQATKE